MRTPSPHRAAQREWREGHAVRHVFDMTGEGRPLAPNPLSPLTPALSPFRPRAGQGEGGRALRPNILGGFVILTIGFAPTNPHGSYDPF